MRKIFPFGSDAETDLDKYPYVKVRSALLTYDDVDA